MSVCAVFLAVTMWNPFQLQLPSLVSPLRCLHVHVAPELEKQKFHSFHRDLNSCMFFCFFNKPASIAGITAAEK